MATDFKVILKNKANLASLTFPYSVKVELGTANSFKVSYYEDEDHSGTLKTITRPRYTFDVYATPNK